jgi:hypothetical protein
MGLATVLDYKRYVPDTPLADVTIAAYLSAAERWLSRRVGRELCVQTATEYLTGSPSPNLVLPRRPVLSVGAVSVDTNSPFGQGDDPFPASTLLTLGTDYNVDLPGGQLILRQSRLWWRYGPVVGPTWAGAARYRGLAGGGSAGWPLVPGCVKVAYTAGLDPKFNADVVQALVELATLQSEAVPGGGLISGSVSHTDVSESGRQFLEQTFAGGKVPLPGSVQSVVSLLATPADLLAVPDPWAWG